MLVGEPRGVFSASSNGVLVYQDGGSQAATSLAWFDPDGKPVAVVGEMGAARGSFLSPDEQYAIVGMNDAEGRLDLWRLTSGGCARRGVTGGVGATVTGGGIHASDGRILALVTSDRRGFSYDVASSRWCRSGRRPYGHSSGLYSSCERRSRRRK